jgi:hypothetical protein
MTGPTTRTTTGSTARKRPGATPTTPPEAADPNDSLGLGPAQRADLEGQVLCLLHREAGAVTLGELFEGYRPVWAGEALARCEAKGFVVAQRRGRDEAKETAWRVTFAGLVELYETLKVETRVLARVHGGMDWRVLRHPLAPAF